MVREGFGIESYRCSFGREGGPEQTQDDMTEILKSPTITPFLFDPGDVELQ